MSLFDLLEWKENIIFHSFFSLIKKASWACFDGNAQFLATSWRTSQSFGYESSGHQNNIILESISPTNLGDVQSSRKMLVVQFYFFNISTVVILHALGSSLVNFYSQILSAQKLLCFGAIMLVKSTPDWQITTILYDDEYESDENAM